MLINRWIQLQSFARFLLRVEMANLCLWGEHSNWTHHLRVHQKPIFNPQLLMRRLLRPVICLLLLVQRELNDISITLTLALRNETSDNYKLFNDTFLKFISRDESFDVPMIFYVFKQCSILMCEVTYFSLLQIALRQNSLYMWF